MTEISEDFAKRLLIAAFRLDRHLGAIDAVLERLESTQERKVLADVLAGLMHDITFEIMAPIFRVHPSLGTPSDPGAWINAGE
jgi:hypothetical protein